MAVPRYVIWGAGKIGRGFIGHLLWRSGLRFTLVDTDAPLVSALREGSYNIRLLGETQTVETVRGFDACVAGSDESRQRMRDAHVLFVSVGGAHLKAAASGIGDALRYRMRTNPREILTVILCENWVRPAEVLRSALLLDANESFAAWLDAYVDFTEAVILRSGIDAPEGPPAVDVQPEFHLPVDGARVRCDLGPIQGLVLPDHFGQYLTQKFYTYNAANGCVAYYGKLLGHRTLSDAAHDERVLTVLRRVYAETGAALCRTYGIDPADQEALAARSLAKVSNVYLTDTVERNARDPMRKLGRHDRLVGPACLAMACGVRPDGLAETIAAAMLYDEPLDPSARQLQALRRAEGPEAVLAQVCDLGDTAHNTLRRMILEHYGRLVTIGV